jgi:hypothetical protein
MFLPVSMAWPASVYSELAPARTVHLGNLARHSRQSIRKGRQLNNKQRDDYSLTKAVKKFCILSPRLKSIKFYLPHETYIKEIMFNNKKLLLANIYGSEQQDGRPSFPYRLFMLSPCRVIYRVRVFILKTKRFLFYFNLNPNLLRINFSQITIR